MEKWSQTFFGYRRENGRVGVRNHVVILPVDDISNAAAEMVGNNIRVHLQFLTAMDACSLEQTLNFSSEQ